MPDFPKPPGGGATAAEVWSYATRELNADGQNTVRDAILSDGTKIPGANVDAAISTVKSKTDNLPADPASESVIGSAILTRAPEGEYDTPMAHLDADVSTRASGADYTSARAAKIDGIQKFQEDSSGTLSATGAEDTIRENTDTGVLHAYIDLTNVQAGDTVIVRQYMKVKTAGSFIKYAEETYSGAQTLPLLHIVSKPAKFGNRITLQQTTGTNRDYDWETFIEKAA